MTSRRLASADFRRLHHGVHVDAAAGHDIATIIQAASLLLPPDGAIGGWAAAWWHGVDRIDGARGRLPVLLCLPQPGRRRRAGVASFRSALAPGDVVSVDGIRVTSPLRTCFDLVRRSVERDDRVAAIDAFRAAGLVSAADLVSYASERPGWRGVGRVMPAARLSAAGTESLPETLLRLAWVADARLPEPLVNPTIVDIRGRLAGRVDLFDPRSALVLEYDGGYHGRDRQRAPDNIRQQRLEQLGLTVVRFAHADLTDDRQRLVRRLVSARHLATERKAAVPRRWRIAGEPLAG